MIHSRSLHKTFALTQRAFRLDARTANSHLMRFGFSILVLIQMIILERSGRFGAPGLELFSWLIYSNTALATFAVPMMFGNAITEEKEERTLALLRVADVGPMTLLIGKTVPRLVILILVLLSQLPFALLSITLGGITFSQIVAAYVAVIAYLLMISFVAVLCSVPFRKTGNSSGAAALIILGYHGIPWLVIALALAIRANPYFTPIWKQLGQTAHELADSVNSVNVFLRLRAILTGGGTEPTWSLQVGVNAAIAALALFVAWVTFDFFNRDLDSEVVARESLWRRILRRGTRPPQRAWHRALAWKEFHFAGGGRAYLIAKLIGYLVIVAVVIFVAGEGRVQIDWRTVGTTLSAIFLQFLLAIEVTLMLARMLHSEVKEKTIGSLMLLPLTTRQLLWEKMKGGFLTVIPVLGFGLASLCIWPPLIPTIFREMSKEPVESIGIALIVFANVLLYWNLTLLFSLSMSPFVAMFAAYAILYYGSLLVYGSIGYLIYYLVGSEETTAYLIVSLNVLATMFLVYFLWLGLPHQIEEAAAKA